MGDHEHIAPDDPRFDRFTIRELWALVARDPADDQEGIIALPPDLAMKHSVAPGMALATDERRASHLRDVATELASLGGLTTRLIHFDVVGSETFAPSVQL